LPQHYLLKTAAPGSHEPYDVSAALAEAWHVDGRYDLAVQSWGALAEAAYHPEEAALKAAIACFALGDEARGTEWLERARAAGTPEDEILYVTAQRHWAGGNWLRAIVDFRAAGSSRARNALGVLLRQLKAPALKEQALAQVERVLLDDPDDACALCNRVSLQLSTIDFEQALSCLGRAAEIAPHRMEPFILHARLCRREGRTEEASRSLAKARLRKAFGGPVHEGASAASPPCEALVEGRVAFEGIALTITFRLHAEHRPSFVALNRAYAHVTIGGLAVHGDGEPATGAGDPRLSDDVRRYPIPEGAFLGDRDQRLLRIEIQGVPAGRCVRMASGEIELGGPSGWLPILPAVETRYRLDVALPPGLTSAVSSSEPELAAVDILAVSGASDVEVPKGAPIQRPVRAVGAVGAAEPARMRLAAYLASSVLTLWTDRLGVPCPPCPPLIFVDKPRSSFCYARAGFVRLASGILRHEGGADLVCHETGHLLWGVCARFTAASDYLAEALAEYSLHLAESAELLPGYSRRALAWLRNLFGGALPDTGLCQLARATNGPSPALLRVRGGFVVAALHRVMGDVPFFNFLRELYALGSGRGRAHRPIDEYTFFALASRVHGHSLNWFANQWLYESAGLSFSVRAARVEHTGSGYRTAFIASSSGLAIPGAPVDFAVETEGGGATRVSVPVNLGERREIVKTAARPIAIHPDPDHRWYASRASTRLESTP
jgi:hypothetical protein